MAYGARAPIIDLSSATGEVARFFEASAQLRGRVPNSSLVWGHIPYIAKFQLPAGVALQREGAGGARGEEHGSRPRRRVRGSKATL